MMNRIVLNGNVCTNVYLSCSVFTSKLVEENMKNNLRILRWMERFR